jgi:cytochrome P450
MIFTNIGITGDIIVFMLEKLAQHPDFQQKLYEEIASRKSDKGFDLSGYVTQSTSLLHYLCTESVRLHPAIGKPIIAYALAASRTC